MALEAIERNAGRFETAKSGRREYVIRDKDGVDFTANTARLLLIATAPAALGDLKIVESECEVDEIEKNIYIGTAPYAPSNAQGKQHVGDFNVSFDISGQQEKRMYSLETIASYQNPSYVTKNFGGAINVNTEGTVDGCDIIVPTTTITINYTLDPADMTEAYFALLARTVGKVNSDTFKNFAPGELLLTRASGSQRDTDHWDLTLGVAVSENKTGLAIGKHTALFPSGKITGIAKDGWDYLWVYYEIVENPTNKVIEKDPSNVYIERVYERVAYSTMSLP